MFTQSILGFSASGFGGTSKTGERRFALTSASVTTLAMLAFPVSQQHK